MTVTHQPGRVGHRVGVVVRVAVTAVYLDVVWLLACLPVVTAPAATVALFETVGRWVEAGEAPRGRDLLRATRRHLAAATVLGGVVAVVVVVLVADLYAIGRMSGSRRAWLVAWLGVTLVLALLLVFAPAALASRGAGVRDALAAGARGASARPVRALVAVACIAALAGTTLAFPPMALCSGVVAAAVVDRLWRAVSRQEERRG